MQLVLRAWNLLGNRLDWSGLDTVTELLGIQEIEWLVDQLTILRGWSNDRS